MVVIGSGQGLGRCGRHHYGSRRWTCGHQRQRPGSQCTAGDRRERCLHLFHLAILNLVSIERRLAEPGCPGHACGVLARDVDGRRQRRRVDVRARSRRRKRIGDGDGRVESGRGADATRHCRGSASDRQPRGPAACGPDSACRIGPLCRTVSARRCCCLHGGRGTGNVATEHGRAGLRGLATVRRFQSVHAWLHRLRGTGVEVPTGTSDSRRHVPGERTLAVWATDAEGRRADAAVAIDITPNSGPTPMRVSARCGGPFRAGDYVPLACVVLVEPGASPSSSGIRAFADLRMFGGPADSGIVRCPACGLPPYVFDLDVRIPSDMSPGEKTFAVWATDAQGRRAETTATFQVTR